MSSATPLAILKGLEGSMGQLPHYGKLLLAAHGVVLEKASNLALLLELPTCYIEEL